MKKLSALLAVLLCLTLCGCPAKKPEVITTEAPATTAATTAATLLNVQITAGKIEPGMTVKDVAVEVLLDKNPIACRLELTALTPNGYYVMAEDEQVGEDALLRLDIYYSLPEGYTVDDIDVTAQCDGGEYDGTGSVGNDDKGCVEAWSHAIYGQIPEQTQPTEPLTEPTTPATEPTTPPTEPPHTHTWTEQVPSYVYISCTEDSQKTYTCTCGQTKTETVPAPGHDMKEGAITQPTCTQIGSQTKTCKRCGYGLIIEIPATGHSWSAWVQKTGRVHARTCSVCGAEEEAPHNIPDGEVTCTDCGMDIIN